MGSRIVRPTGGGTEAVADMASRPPHTSSMGPAGPTLLELFGPPGAGKTTLASALIRRTGCGGRLRPSEDWKQLPVVARLRFLAAVACDLGMTGVAVGTALRLRLWSPESLLRLVRIVLKSAWLRRMPRRAVLDQSLLQDIWSVLWSSGRFEPDPRALAPLMRRAYRGMAVRVVYLDLGSDEAAHRIAGRSKGHSRLDGLDEGEVARRLGDGADLPRRIVAAARLAGLHVTDLDARASPDRLAEDALRVWASRAPVGAP